MAGHLGFRSFLAAIMLTGLGDPVAGEPAGPPTIVVEVFDHAGVSAETLTRAKHDVSRIYRDLGVEVLWTDAAAKDAHGRFIIHLMIRPNASRPRVMGKALGDSHDTGGTAFVYRDRVVDVARGRDLAVARVLAYAMAHEMGHLLLPYPLMRSPASCTPAGTATSCGTSPAGPCVSRRHRRTRFAPGPRCRLEWLLSAEACFRLLHSDKPARWGRTFGPTIQKLRKLIDRGLTQSSTFRDIVCRIDRLGGLVHVVASRCGSLSRLSACLDHDVRVRGAIQ